MDSGPSRVSMRTGWRRAPPSRTVLGPMPKSSPTSTAAGSPAGEFQQTTPGGTGRHREKNASRTDSAHVFRLWLGPCQAGLEPALTQKRFSTADRRGALCVVASPDGRRGSLLLHQDALLYSALESAWPLPASRLIARTVMS